MKKIGIILILLALSFGCTELMKRVAVKELEFNLKRVSLIDYDLSTMTLKIDLDAYNPNDIDAVIDRLDYSFYINEKNAANGTTARKETVKAGKEKIVSTTLRINYLSLGVAILEAVKDKKADFRMEGTVFVETPVGAITFPIELFYP
ncbi:LEA type 2 family protein [candidate division WOR-3 bacterium]|nr:LEA type 2 family protein [candidate division WOR-3 bacterium]